jgi:DNA-binding CsgD family transcriptional regulator
MRHWYRLREEPKIPIKSLRVSPEVKKAIGPSMKTLLADLAAKSSPEGDISALKQWLFVRRDVLRYALAPLAVTVAFLARLALTPILGDASPYLLFVPAVLAAGGLGGLGPGLLATGLSVVFGFFVVTISPSMSVGDRQCFLLASVRSALEKGDCDRKHESERSSIQSRLVGLSNRERDILDGLIAGRANKQIAYDLGISARTIENYRANLMLKMQAATLSDLVRMALTAGILGAKAHDVPGGTA